MDSNKAADTDPAGNMRWASAISRNTSFDEAVRECASAVRETLGDGHVSVVFAFVSPHFAAYYPRLHEAIDQHLGPEVLLGCSGGGVIGGSQEIEGSPALSLTAARLPNVTLTPFHLRGALPDLDGPPDAWESFVGVDPTTEPEFVLLADPFSVPVRALLAGLDYAYPAASKVGGLASGGTSPGTNVLFLDEQVHTSGTVGLALSGDVVMDTVVAQGCRPLGDLLTVTRCEGSMLLELDGRPAFEALRDLFSTLDERDRRLAGSALFVGILLDDLVEQPEVGDFLIRNLTGIDPKSGAIAVGDNLQPGMRLRFHVRDAETSTEDLHNVLSTYTQTLPNPASISGALLFSCLGRGAGLYGEPDHDTGILREHLGDISTAGFFCNGEIGPVSNSTFLHGYTSSIALFRPKE